MKTRARALAIPQTLRRGPPFTLFQCGLLPLPPSPYFSFALFFFLALASGKTSAARIPHAETKTVDYAGPTASDLALASALTLHEPRGRGNGRHWPHYQRVLALTISSIMGTCGGELALNDPGELSSPSNGGGKRLLPLSLSIPHGSAPDIWRFAEGCSIGGGSMSPGGGRPRCPADPARRGAGSWLAARPRSPAHTHRSHGCSYCCSHTRSRGKPRNLAEQ